MARSRTEYGYQVFTPRLKRGEARELSNGETFGLNKNARRLHGRKPSKAKKQANEAR